LSMSTLQHRQAMLGRSHLGVWRQRRNFTQGAPHLRRAALEQPTAAHREQRVACKSTEIKPAGQR
jgi:hypothetical protein